MDFMNNATFFVKTLILQAFISSALWSQERQSVDSLTRQIDNKFEALNHRLDQLEKAVDDVQWYN